MSVITTLLSGDALEPTSRNNINTNFANLNTDKQEKPVGAVTNNIVLFGASNVLVDSGKAVPTGVIVGTSDAQALTNKDLTSGTNTFPTSLVTLTGTQTLTNKTLTAPIVSDFTNAGHNHQNAAGGGTLDAAVIATGVIAVARLPVMVASGASHAAGIVPDPGASAGTTKFLREDGSWQVPASAGALYACGNASRASNTASGNQTIAHGLGVTPKYIRITCNYHSTANTTNIAHSFGSYNGTTNSNIYTSYGSSASLANASAGNIIVITENGALTNFQTASATFDATNITIAWTKNGTLNNDNINIFWEAFA